MSLEDKILEIKKISSGTWGERICAELGYAAAVSYVNDHRFDRVIEEAADSVLSASEAVGGVITRDIALATV